METYMRKPLLAIALCLFASPALAQNPTCPTRSVGDSSNACASTAFVAQELLPVIIPVVTCNGATDNSTSINLALIAAASAGGATVQLPAGSCAIASTLVNHHSNVYLKGVGNGHNHDVGAVDYGTQLLWTGSVGGTMIDWSPTSDVSAQRISGGGDRPEIA